MRAVIVDDEYYALHGLQTEILAIGGIEVAGLYEDGASFLAEVVQVRPDVVFMDIEMPVMDGFLVMEKLIDTGLTPEIIFITAYSQYAVKAFEVNALDYIVKPVNKDRLKRVIERLEAGPNKSITQLQKPSRLQITCFGQFSILADGKEISAGWRTRKAEELVAYLVCRKGRFISKDKVAEVLWPDLDAEKAMANLYLANYYIRKQEEKTGTRIPIESERGKMRIRMDELSCDLMEFDRLLQEHPDAIPIEHMERAVALVTGDLFETSYYHWAHEFQAVYEGLLANTLLKLIHHFEKTGEKNKWKQYLELYQSRFDE